MWFIISFMAGVICHKAFHPVTKTVVYYIIDRKYRSKI